MVIIFQVKNTFSPVHQNHYLFTPRDLTRWCLGFLRYNLKEDEHSVNLVLEVSALAYSLLCMNFVYMYWIFWKCILNVFSNILDRKEQIFALMFLSWWKRINIKDWNSFKYMALWSLKGNNICLVIYCLWLVTCCRLICRQIIFVSAAADLWVSINIFLGLWNCSWCEVTGTCVLCCKHA
jgi:hypothetical protein